MKELSKIASSIPPSATVTVDTLAKKLRSEGVDLISFCVGEPDFNTPERIKNAGIRAIETNKTKYTAPSGTQELKEAICKRLKEDMGLTYEPSQINVANGAKHIIYTSLQVLINPGDEVIIPAPYWVTYSESVRMAHGVPVILQTKEENRFKLSPEELRAAITDRTKCFILTNPSNPTGMIYSEEELRALAEVIAENDLYVISDEIYHCLVFNGKFVSFASLTTESGEAMKDRTIVINGVAKTYAMTGWRIGYSASSPQISKLMNTYLSQSIGNPSSIAQYAAQEAFDGDQREVQDMVDEFNKRRKYCVKRINEIEGLSCEEPDGAFYIFMNIKQLFGKTLFGEKIENSTQFSKLLLTRGRVATVPGIAFGTEGYLRLSYSTSMENLVEGLNRIENFLIEGSK